VSDFEFTDDTGDTDDSGVQSETKDIFHEAWVKMASPLSPLSPTAMSPVVSRCRCPVPGRRPYRVAILALTPLTWTARPREDGHASVLKIDGPEYGLNPDQATPHSQCGGLDPTTRQPGPLLAAMPLGIADPRGGCRRGQEGTDAGESNRRTSNGGDHQSDRGSDGRSLSVRRAQAFVHPLSLGAALQNNAGLFIASRTQGGFRV
jgi:hypothetical protein